MSYTLILPVSPAGAIISDTPPLGAGEGLQWFDSSTGTIFTLYGGFWIQTGTGAVTTSVTAESILELIGDGTTISDEYLPTPTPPTVDQLLTTLGDGTKISSVYLPDVTTGSVLQVPGATYNIPASAGFRYLRRSHTAASTSTIQPYAAGTYAYAPDCVIPIRNASTSYIMTLVPASGVTLNYAAGRNQIGPLEDAVIRRIGSTDSWDIC